MSQKTRELKKKSKLIYEQSKRVAKEKADRFYYRTSRMSEAQVAELANDACVYLGVAVSSAPRVAYISTDANAKLEVIGEAFDGPLPEGETVSVLRPGKIGLVTMDTLEITNLGLLLVSTTIVEKDGVKTSSKTPFVQNDGSIVRLDKYWRTVDESLHGYTPEVKSLYCSAVTTAAILHSKRTKWSSVMSVQGQGVGLITDATCLREMFRLRDKPEGKTRRDALVHIVKGHWRKYSKATECRRYVESYLRGKTEFDWFGLDVKVHTNGIDL
jgi:hypothetical protein